MLIFINEIYLIIIFIMGVLVFSIKRKHLLCTLLSLEFIVLRLFYLIFIYLINFNFEFSFLILFLVFRVCEGALGLSILVRIVRTHGNDFFNSFNLLRC